MAIKARNPKYAEKYPTKRYLKFERVVREKVEGGYYHIPEHIRCPETCFDTIMGVMDLERETQEIFGILILNTKNKVIGVEVVHKGSLNSSLVHPRDVFLRAVTANAASIVCFHNHPSGNPEPSREDIEVTKRLKEAGQILGIEVLDHIITGEDGRFYSLKEKGRM
jgi:DNA repair protein RadC